MNKYENVVIVDPNITEENLNKLIDRFTKLINKHGKVVTVENTGLKQLAYEIKKNKEAYYIVYNFESEPNFIEELQRNYRITDEVLKFLVIRVDEFISKIELKTQAKKEDKEEQLDENLDRKEIVEEKEIVKSDAEKTIEKEISIKKQEEQLDKKSEKKEEKK